MCVYIYVHIYIYILYIYIVFFPFCVLYVYYIIQEWDQRGDQHLVDIGEVIDNCIVVDAKLL